VRAWQDKGHSLRPPVDELLARGLAEQAEQEQIGALEQQPRLSRFKRLSNKVGSLVLGPAEERSYKQIKVEGDYMGRPVVLKLSGESVQGYINHSAINDRHFGAYLDHMSQFRQPLSISVDGVKTDFHTLNQDRLSLFGAEQAFERLRGPSVEPAPAPERTAGEAKKTSVSAGLKSFYKTRILNQEKEGGEPTLDLVGSRMRRPKDIGQRTFEEMGRRLDLAGRLGDDRPPEAGKMEKLSMRLGEKWAATTEATTDEPAAKAKKGFRAKIGAGLTKFAKEMELTRTNAERDPVGFSTPGMVSAFTHYEHPVDSKLSGPLRVRIKNDPGRMRDFLITADPDKRSLVDYLVGNKGALTDMAVGARFLGKIEQKALIDSMDMTQLQIPEHEKLAFDQLVDQMTKQPGFQDAYDRFHQERTSAV